MFMCCERERGEDEPVVSCFITFVFVWGRGKSLNASFKAASSPAKTRKWQIRKRSQICNRRIISNLQGIKPRYSHTYLPETLSETHRIPGKAAVPAEHNGHSMLTADSRRTVQIIYYTQYNIQPASVSTETVVSDCSSKLSTFSKTAHCTYTELVRNFKHALATSKILL
jgi:hypothetical protein